MFHISHEPKLKSKKCRKNPQVNAPKPTLNNNIKHDRKKGEDITLYISNSEFSGNFKVRAFNKLSGGPLLAITKRNNTY